MDLQLEQIEKELDAANVPKEVFIGTNSVADRVTWLILNRKANRRTARARFHKFSVEFGILTTLDGAKERWFALDEIRGRLGYGRREEVKLALNYLAERELIQRVSDEQRGDIFSALDETSKSYLTVEQIENAAEDAVEAQYCQS